MKIVIALIAWLALAPRLAAQTNGEPEDPKRFALVIGNSAYKALPRLRSAAAEASNMAAKLNALGFAVDTASIDSAQEFEDVTLPRFVSKLREGDIALVYVTGHGFAYGPDNWIAPLSMPLNVPKAWMPDSAVSLNEIGSVLAEKAPALIIVISDACRGIAGFVIDDGTGGNLAGNGIVEDPQFGTSNGMIGYATKRGFFAMGIDAPDQMSPFTRDLVNHLDTEGSRFTDVFDEVKLDVAAATNDSQVPTLLSWASPYFYIRPTDTIRRQERAMWELARERGDSGVAVFVRKYATSRFAREGRQRLRTPPQRVLADAPHTASSPAAIERIWASPDKVKVVTPPAIGLAFDRVVDVKQAAAVERLSDREIGASRSAPAPGTTAKAAADATAATAHTRMVATRDFIGLEAPALRADTILRVPAGTKLDVVEAHPTTNGAVWVTARLQDTVVYFRATASATDAQPNRLGKALTDLLVRPDTSSLEGFVDVAMLRNSIAGLQRKHMDIRWVSLATEQSDTLAVSDTRRLMLIHAEATLESLGIPGTRVTSVASSPDSIGHAVRVRVFGWEP